MTELAAPSLHHRLDRISRLSPLSGVLAVLLWVAAVVLIDRNELSVLGSSDTASGAQLAAYLEGEATTIYLGTTLWGLGAVAFLSFAALLRERLRAADASSSWAFGCAAIAVATMFGFFAMRLGATMALETREAGLSDDAVEAL